MAHYKRRRSRRASMGHYSGNGLRHRLGSETFDGIRWLGSYPRWWDYIHHTRPARAAGRKLIRQVMAGADPENICWPDGRKPHVYYW